MLTSMTVRRMEILFERVVYQPALKAKLIDGPWQDEPDKVQFRAHGLPCLAVRGPMGAWCGYVGVYPDHPDFNREYMDDEMNEIRVHGGLTYGARPCSPGEGADGICHVPQKDEKEPHWFGFDCAHSGDAWGMSKEVRSYSWMDGTYRTLEYVVNEVVDLAEQLAARAGA